DARPVSTCHAFENECARKKTQAKQVRLKTRNTRSVIRSQSKDLRRAGDPSLRSGWRRPSIRSATRYVPCNAPQKTNVQLAPCQSPPRSMVIIRLRYVR